MAALVGKRVRTTQPPPWWAQLIDWTNPIAAGLVLAVCNLDAGYGFSVNGSTVFPYSGGTQINTPAGSGGRSNSATSSLFNVPQHGLTTTNYSLFAFATCGSNSVTQNALDMDNSSPRYFQFRLNAGKVDFIPFNTSAAVTGQPVFGQQMAVSEMSRGFAMGATASSTRIAAFQNDLIATATPTNLIAPTQALPLFVGSRASGTAGGWNNGAIIVAFAWARTLADSEMQSVIANPYQMFKPHVRRLWLARAVAAAYVLQASAGEFLLSASRAVMSAARRLVAEAGSLTSNWVSANLLVSRRLPADASGFTVTGAAATIAAARKLAANVGVYGVTVAPASITVTRRLSTQSGAFVLSPSSVQMVYTPASGPSGPTYTLTAAAGEFALTSAATGLLVRRQLSAASASFEWSGADASLLAGRRIPAGVGMFDVAGSSVTLLAARRVLAESGVFSVAGGDAQLRYSGQINYARAPVGAGYAPKQHYNERRPSAAGAARPAATQRNNR